MKATVFFGLLRGVLIEAPAQLFNLKDYPEENRQDIQAYIQECTQRYIQKSIQQHIQKGLHLSAANKQTFGANKRGFIQQLTNTSENNFMYVNQILTALETDLCLANSSLTEILDGTYFPPALETYYQQNLQKMFPAEEADPIAQAVLNTLIQSSLVQDQSPPLQPRGQTVEEISQIIDADEYDVEEVLENWIEFLTVHQIDGDNKYGLYHGNFGKWLSAHPQSKYL